MENQPTQRPMDSQKTTKVSEPKIPLEWLEYQFLPNFHSLIAGMGILLLLMCGYLCTYWKFFNPEAAPSPAILSWFPVGIGVGIALLILSSCIRSRLILRREERQLICSYQFLSWEKRVPFLPFAHLTAVISVGYSCHSRFGRWLEYGVGLLDSAGNLHRFSNQSKTGRLDANRRAEALAKVIGCRFHECPPNSYTRITKGFGGKCEVCFEEQRK